MRFRPTAIEGCWVLELDPVVDERGWFARTFCANEFTVRNLDARVVQCNASWNPRRGTVRGLHLQLPPAAETRIVRCTRGEAFDVMVDLRRGSPTFRRWFASELSAENHRGHYVAPGVAHGFQTLRDDTEIFYQHSVAYEPALQAGVRWNDPVFDIRWPLSVVAISERDAAYPDFV